MAHDVTDSRPSRTLANPRRVRATAVHDPGRDVLRPALPLAEARSASRLAGRGAVPATP